jgi:hypothetical protein
MFLNALKFREILGLLGVDPDPPSLSWFVARVSPAYLILKVHQSRSLLPRQLNAYLVFDHDY